MAQPQPDFPVLRQSLNAAVDQLEGLPNLPALQDIMGWLQGLENRMNERFDRMNERFDRIDQRFDQLEEKQDINHRIAHKRTLNFSVSHNSSELYAVPLPDGGMPDNFPRTFNDLRRLSGVRVDSLLRQYQLEGPGPIEGTLDEKRKRLAHHIGNRYL